MNKNLRKIIAIALVFGTISAVAPATNINLLTTKAYAADENDVDTLTSLELLNDDDDTIKLYSDNDYDSDNKVDDDEVEQGETYYAKTSSDSVSIDIDGPDSDYVRVFKSTSDSAKGKETGDDLSLSSGTTTLTVRIYSTEPDSGITYEEDDDSIGEYTIKVKCTADDDDDDDDDSSDDDDDYDDIYLDSLSVEGNVITLSDSDTDYSYDVDSDVDEVTIRARPEDEDEDTVTIDGDDVDDTDKYKNTVDLDEGANEFKIEIEDEDSNYREYTLTINRGSTSSTTDSEAEATTAATAAETTATAVVTTTVVANKWVQVNGFWQYNDSIGNIVKSNWVGNYYLGVDGNMVTGWLSTGGKWYYLGTDGAMKKGWQSVNGTWYYMDAQGIMAYNTTINGYKLGATGAWTK